MQSLINFSFLEFPNDFHIFFADGLIFEIIEFGGILTKIKQIDFSFMLLIKLFDIIFDIEVIAIL